MKKLLTIFLVMLVILSIAGCDEIMEINTVGDIQEMAGEAIENVDIDVDELKEQVESLGEMDISMDFLKGQFDEDEITIEELQEKFTDMDIDIDALKEEFGDNPIPLKDLQKYFMQGDISLRDLLGD